MKYDWIIDKLKENTEEATKEVLYALENATADDIAELGKEALAHAMAMKILKIDKYCNRYKDDNLEVDVHGRDC